MAWPQLAPKHKASLESAARSLETKAVRSFLPESDSIYVVCKSAASATGRERYVFSGLLLQDRQDYRSAIREWFDWLEIGGRLVITVPHSFIYERQYSSPSRWTPDQQRLYTPASLLAEIEESLQPNTYRIRFLHDDDEGYDYSASPDQFPVGRHEIIVGLERIRSPVWSLSDSRQSNVAEPAPLNGEGRVRIEQATPMAANRILALKLDHLGDFVMSIPALRRLREAFAGSHITLVVGAWNYDLAVGLGLFDKVLSFDAFPRNSSEIEPDVSKRVADFSRAVPDFYDLAIDLRTDHDTRQLLKLTNAKIKAGIGNKTEFVFLDIFLPLDASRRYEAARDDIIAARDFQVQASAERLGYETRIDGARSGSGILVFGPYRTLASGSYSFEPFVELDRSFALLDYDIALDTKPLLRGTIARGERRVIDFFVPTSKAEFEFRIFAPLDTPIPSFRFFGGRLIKRASENVLHQSEYVLLLVELVARRMVDAGLLRDRISYG